MLPNVPNIVTSDRAPTELPWLANPWSFSKVNSPAETSLIVVTHSNWMDEMEIGIGTVKKVRLIKHVGETRTQRKSCWWMDSRPSFSFVWERMHIFRRGEIIHASITRGWSESEDQRWKLMRYATSWDLWTSMESHSLSIRTWNLKADLKFPAQRQNKEIERKFQLSAARCLDEQDSWFKKSRLREGRVNIRIVDR